MRLCLCMTVLKLSKARLAGLRAAGRLLAGLALAGFGAAWAPAGAAGGASSAAPGAPAATAAAATAAAKTGPVRVEAVEVELVAETEAIVPGQAARLGLRLKHDPHWHSYWRNPGDSGLATQLALDLPPGFAAGAIEWPAPRRLFIPPLANYGYEAEIVLPVPLQVPQALAGDRVRFAGRASWLMCREVCIPGEADLALELPVRRAGEAPRSRFAALFDAADAGMPRTRIAARAHAEGATLSIGLPVPAASVEFFPYREGLLRNAEAQVLHAIDGGVRLAVALSEDGVRRVREDDAGVAQAAEGIVVVDGVARELDVTVSAAALAAGREIARVAGAAQASVDLPGRRGIDLPALRDGAGALSGALSGTFPGAFSGAAPSGATSSGATSSGATSSGAAASGVSSLWVALLFGALGGLILNLMPCVFPVIGLKVLGFAREGGSRARALAFAAGVVASFWVLAGLLLGLRAAGEAAGWGFQLQSPAFVAAMALLFVAIGLNFSGVYEAGVGLTRLGGLEHRAAPAHPLAGAFASGVLAVLVATPCTAPFMGSALGFTLGSPALEALAVFTAIGVGMAVPYVLLGLFPGWLRWLPRPGRWMETLRQFLAFPMYATAAWLAWVLGQQAGIDAVFALAIGAVLLAFALWLAGRFVQRGGDLRRRWVAAPALAAFALALWTAWPSGADGPPARADAAARRDDALAWQPWSSARVDAALAQGRPVFVDFTAAWCVTCQANKRLVLERASVLEAMARRDVLRLKADWTQRDPAISDELARHGRSGVPLYLLYRPGDAGPRRLPELLTPGMVLEALASISPASVADRAGR